MYYCLHVTPTWTCVLIPGTSVRFFPGSILRPEAPNLPKLWWVTVYVQFTINLQMLIHLFRSSCRRCLAWDESKKPYKHKCVFLGIQDFYI